MADIDFDAEFDYKTFDKTEIGIEPFNFPGYEEETRKRLYEFTVAVDFVASHVAIVKFFLSFIGIFLNILHLVVLTRKSMRNNSINMILTSLAIHDIIAMILTIYISYRSSTKAQYDIFCTPVDMVYDNAKELFSDLLRSFIRRSSSWIAILMATVRVICIKNYEDPRYSLLSTYKFGIIASISEFIISSFFSIPALYPIFKNGLYKSDIDTDWTPDEMCKDFPKELEFEKQVAYSSEDVERNYVIDGVTINLIPSILYPILTIILIRQFRKAKKKLNSVGNENKNDRVTYIVIWMTILFIIAELPQAFADFVLPAFLKTPGFLWLGNNIKTLFSVLSILNGATHCLICFALASNYRNTVFGLLRIKRKNKITLGPLRSTTQILHSSTTE